MKKYLLLLLMFVPMFVFGQNEPPLISPDWAMWGGLIIVVLEVVLRLIPTTSPAVGIIGLILRILNWLVPNRKKKK